MNLKWRFRLQYRHGCCHVARTLWQAEVDQTRGNCGISHPITKTDGWVIRVRVYCNNSGSRGSGCRNRDKFFSMCSGKFRRVKVFRSVVTWRTRLVQYLLNIEGISVWRIKRRVCCHLWEEKKLKRWTVRGSEWIWKIELNRWVMKYQEVPAKLNPAVKVKISRGKELDWWCQLVSCMKGSWWFVNTLKSGELKNRERLSFVPQCVLEISWWRHCCQINYSV